MDVSRRQAFSNFAWKLAEQIGAQTVSFVVSIILARLLMPEDYSVISIIAILSGFCAVFIDSGLGNSLIQKKNADILDFSTVLYVSVFISVLLYGMLFIGAPYIAQIYQNDLLKPVVRVYSLNLIIGAYNTVQCAYISKKLQFKKYFLATIVGTVISAVIGVYMAYQGYGAWALVAQQMINPAIDTFILFLSTDFRPKFCFSFERLKKLWKYGSRVLGTSLLDMLYDNTRPLIVGIKFNTVDLAYYQKGSSYPGLINSTLNSTLAAVLFPVIASVQDSFKQVKSITQKYIRVASFILFPSLLGLAAVAPNLIVWMITDNWAPAVPYMQIFCINYMFQLLQTGNLQAINAVGRSDIVLKLAIIKKSINFIFLFILIWIAKTPFSLAALGIVTSAIAFFINAKANKKILKYGFREQVADILPNFLSSVIMAIVVILVGRIEMPLLPLIFVQILSGAGVYVLEAIITHNSSYFYCLDTVKGYLKR